MSDPTPATQADVQDLANKVVGLQGAVQDLDAHAREVLDQALAALLQQLPAALEQATERATERALRRVATDPQLHTKIGLSILQQATRNMHERAGKWLFSRWAAMAVLVFVVAQYIGWAATAKALLGLFKGGGA